MKLPPIRRRLLIVLAILLPLLVLFLLSALRTGPFAPLVVEVAAGSSGAASNTAATRPARDTERQSRGPWFEDGVE